MKVQIQLLLLTFAVTFGFDTFPVPKAVFQGSCDDVQVFCQQVCLNRYYGGYQCWCKDGYELNDDGITCREVSATRSVPAPNHTWYTIPQTHNVDTKYSTPSTLHTQTFTENQPQGREKETAKKAAKLSDSKHDIVQGDDPRTIADNRVPFSSQSDIKNEKSSDKYDDFDSSSSENIIVPVATHDKRHENSVLSRQTKAPVKYTSCNDLDCFNGGSCVPDVLRGGVRCQCRLGFDGDYCEQEMLVRYPKFMGTGYVSFPVLRRAFKEMTVTLEFRPDTQNGLLLFSGEHPDAHTDFFSVSLIDGYVEFRFDCGTGMAKIRTTSEVKLGKWNTVTVHRHEWDGSVQLNKGEQVRGRAQGLFSRITFRTPLFLGGYINTTHIGSRTGMYFGFIGCVKAMKINGKEFDFRKGAFIGDAIDGVDVAECSAHICRNSRCRNGGSCMADSPDTYTCLCPMMTAGKYCERSIEHIVVPQFTGHSFLQYEGIRRTALSYTEIELVFKATNKDGTLLYNGFTTDRRGDFISLALVDGYLEYRFDLGTGPAIIRSSQPLPLNAWHTVKISRTGRDGVLEVNEQPAVQGLSQGAYTQLTLLQDLFIGGHRNYDDTSKYAKVKQSFQGCIQKVVVNNKPLSLMEDYIDGINIDTCSHPCSTKPCENNGKCVPYKNFYTCNCPLGFTNTNCEETVYDDVTVPMFRGNSFLKYNDEETMKRIKGKKLDIKIRLKTSQSDGLILWSSEEHTSTTSDYVAIGLRGGYVHFQYNLGSGEADIMVNTTRIDDGKWHRIHAKRLKQDGSLKIDDLSAQDGRSPGRFTQLNTNTQLFLGAVNDMAEKTLHKYTGGFVGCISHFTLATDYHVKFVAQASSGQNINQCS
ncbi:pikachurin [Lingula anatina]|uniref:Pikachurin n=1 Tax=Lingula anatina TaxID=7574 RepID=A0A1S3JWI8_LINAN|nr:pikachurin [Lingula anatina]|eukprot:XP_013414404.1 pikachurin [Lingula anatina]